METLLFVLFETDDLQRHRQNQEPRHCTDDARAAQGQGGVRNKSFHRFAGLTNAWDGGMTISKGFHVQRERHK